MAGVYPAYLRCEYHQDPEGIDVRKPRLSWILEAGSPDARGLSQTAYQVLVSESLDELQKNQERSGFQENQIGTINACVYDGTPLTCGMECWWKVRVWDHRGKPSDWSAPARWSMGLLDSSDWTAEWIGYDERPKDGAMVNGETPPVPFLRKTFAIKKNRFGARLRMHPLSASTNSG